MKSNVMKPISALLLVIVPLFFSCSDNPSEPKNQPPAVPPLSTMVMDYDDFNIISLAKPEAKANWLWAAGNVAFWNTALTVTMAVPVAAFAASFQYPPILKSDGTWVWAYDFSIGPLQYSAELTAKVGLNGITWNMYVSLNGVFNDFHWFTGRSDLFATAGYWQLNLRPADPVTFLQVDWTRDPETQALDITYTNIVPDGDENGSYIHQALNQPGEFTGMMDIYRVSNENLVEIMWDRETLAGRIKDPKHFSNDDWHCWDGNFNDTECE